MRNKRAFTLIELLVVIAIIAILAAILFPVFAQAKTAAKKIQTISNMKQLGTATLIYVADYDDLFPSAYWIQANSIIRTWPVYSSTYYPADSSGNWAGVAGLDGMHTLWHNSIEPYKKNLELTEVAGVQKNAFAIPATATRGQGYSALNMNGLLHHWPTTAVNNPSKVPLVWAGLGAWNQGGLAHTNPQLECGSSPLPQTGCIYGSSLNGGVQVRFGTGSPFVANSHHLYAGGTIVTNTDSSTRFIRIGNGTADALNNNPFGDPWAAYDPAQKAGTPTGTYYICATGSKMYPCFFAPNREN